jgi:hypothetical protein
MSGPGSARVLSRPDPERLAAGWEFRFVVEGLRAEAMVQLYESLGFEVCSDPLLPELLPSECHDCRLAVALGFRAVYTRKRPA